MRRGKIFYRKCALLFKVSATGRDELHRIVLAWGWNKQRRNDSAGLKLRHWRRRVDNWLASVHTFRRVRVRLSWDSVSFHSCFSSNLIIFTNFILQKQSRKKLWQNGASTWGLDSCLNPCLEKWAVFSIPIPRLQISKSHWIISKTSSRPPFYHPDRLFSFGTSERNQEGSEIVSASSLRFWSAAVKTSRENEIVKTEKVKLRTFRRDKW